MGRLDIPDKYRDEDYQHDYEEGDMQQANYFAPLIGEKVSPTLEELKEIYLREFPVNRRVVRDGGVNRPATTIGKDERRPRGKGANSDITRRRS